MNHNNIVSNILVSSSELYKLAKIITSSNNWVKKIKFIIQPKDSSFFSNDALYMYPKDFKCLILSTSEKSNLFQSTYTCRMVFMLYFEIH